MGETHQIPRDSDVGIWGTFKETLFLRNLYSFLPVPAPGLWGVCNEGESFCLIPEESFRCEHLLCAELQRVRGLWALGGHLLLSLHGIDGDTEARGSKSQGWGQVPNVHSRALFTCFQWTLGSIINCSRFTGEETKAQIPRGLLRVFPLRTTVIYMICKRPSPRLSGRLTVNCVPLKFQGGEHYPQVRCGATEQVNLL